MSARLFQLALLLFAVPLSASGQEKSEVNWVRDIDQAKQIAPEQNKRIFVLFTGRGWCQPCEMLNQLLFQNEDFVRAVKEDFVLVELDFNFGEGPEEELREARYRTWAEEYLVRGYPTMIFAGEDGRPFFISQYPEGTAEEFLLRIEKSIVQCRKRDASFSRAKDASGQERAEHLHAGVSAVSGLLTTVEERQDDPVLTYYAPEVATILATPANTAPMREIHATYRERLATLDQWAQSHRIWDKIGEFRESEDFGAGIRYVEKVLSDASDLEQRWRLERHRQRFLEASGQTERALENVQSLLERDLGADATRYLRRREVSLLFELGRDDEGFQACEQWVSATAKGTPSRLKALYEKGMWLRRKHPGSDETVAAWEEYRNEAEPDTFEWMTATAYLARSMRDKGRPEKAAQLFERILGVLERQRDGELEIRWPWSWQSAPAIMLEAADCYISAASRENAERLANEAAKEIDHRIASTTRASEKRYLVEKQQELARLRASLNELNRDRDEPNVRPETSKGTSGDG